MEEGWLDALVYTQRQTYLADVPAWVLRLSKTVSYY